MCVYYIVALLYSHKCGVTGITHGPPEQFTFLVVIIIYYNICISLYRSYAPLLKIIFGNFTNILRYNCMDLLPNHTNHVRK